ncbi:MAG TPA: chemotaxis protein CheX [Chloroflexota bacterium]|jgi:chemotaxis protein CheX
MTEAVLASDEGLGARQPVATMPRAEHLEPFLTGAREVLETDPGGTVERGALRLEAGSHTTQDVTAIVAITGALTGLAVYGMSRATALALVGQLMGEPVAELDDVALSGIGELGNVITGRAATLLAKQGIVAEITPPVLLVGVGSRVSTAGIRRLVVPLVASVGTLEAQLAIKGQG